MTERRTLHPAFRQGYDAGYRAGRRDALLEAKADVAAGWQCPTCQYIWSPDVRHCWLCHARSLESKSVSA